MGIVMRERELVSLFLEFGGTVTTQPPKVSKHSVTYKYNATSNQAKRVALTLLPYLKGKHKQAQLVINFQDLKEQQGNKPLEDMRYFQYVGMYEEMKRLNTKGIGKHVQD
jgi:hypothetical protein